MSVEVASAHDMLFLMRLMAISNGDSSVDELANQFITSLVDHLGVDAIAILLLEEGTLRPIAWHGLDLVHSVRFSPDAPLYLTEQPKTAISMPLIYRGHIFGRLHIDRGHATAPDSPISNQSVEPDDYDQAFLQVITHTISSALFSNQLQDRLTRTQFHLNSIVENLPFALGVFDSTRKVLLSNQLARTFVGRPNWDQIDESPNLYQIRDAAGNILPTTEWPYLKAIRQPTKSISQEYVLDFGEFQRRVLVSVIPVCSESSDLPIFVTFAEDITARTELDRRKDDFLTVASHELRSPLTPLLGFMQMARHQAESEQPVDIDVLLRAERQAHRIRRLLEGLLDFSRIETGRLQLVCRQVNLVDQLSVILEPWYSVADSTTPFQITLPKKPLFAMIDPDRIEQVITNIVDNALKHGRSDGMVSVNLSKVGSNALITVSNEVDGMDSFDLTHVFDRFYQRNKSRGSFRTSMGLGLYISRQIIEQHGGSIEMQTVPGAHTTVQIILPLVKPSKKQ